MAKMIKEFDEFEIFSRFRVSHVGERTQREVGYGCIFPGNKTIFINNVLKSTTTYDNLNSFIGEYTPMYGFVVTFLDTKLDIVNLVSDEIVMASNPS